MPNISFQKYRVMIDEAITYNEPDKARELAREAYTAAQLAEVLGERMYFGAQLLILEEDFAGAIRSLDAAIKYNPKDGAAYNDRALCMIELGQIDDALQYFDRGIEVEPDFATIHHNKGWYLSQLGHYTGALASFSQVLALDANRAVTYENMADCFYKMGCIPEAIKAYQKAVSLLSDRCVDIKHELERLIQLLKALQVKK